MHLSTTAQNDTATRIAKWIRENTTGYATATTEVGQAGHPGVAVVAVIRRGSTTCTAKIGVHPNRIVYVSKRGGRISYPAAPRDADWIVGGFLRLEED